MGIWQQRLSAITDGSLTLPLVTQLLGLGRLTRWSEGYVEKEWKVDPGFCTGDGADQQALFGGYLAALADQVLTFATMTVMDDKHAFKTSELHVSFFRPITEGTVRIVGRVVNRSRTLVHVEAEFYRDDGKLAAKASATELVQPMTPEVAAMVNER
jgi:uncharacterized protein (TIGR00369 family)